MSNQTIPITLQWGPTGEVFTAADIDQLGTFLAAHLSGSIRKDVSFYLEVLFDPTNQVSGVNRIFNITQRIDKYWDQAQGRYVPITQYQNGDVKNTFIGGDQISVGWVLLDGRAISAIPGITTTQTSVLESLFGAGGNLPVVSPTNTQNLPGAAAFSSITKPVVLPPNGGMSGTYVQAEAEALRDSAAAIEVQAAAIQDMASTLLLALRSSTTPLLYAQVFCGFP